MCRCRGILQGFIECPHAVAVGIIVGAALKLLGLVERCNFDVHRNGLGKFAVHHHVSAHRCVATIHHGASHQQVHHQRVARGERAVAAVGRHLIISGAHFFHVHRQCFAQFQAARELVEIELPIFFQWSLAHIFDDEARTVVAFFGFVSPHFPSHGDGRGLCHGTECHCESSCKQE